MCFKECSSFASEHTKIVMIYNRIRIFCPSVHLLLRAFVKYPFRFAGVPFPLNYLLDSHECLALPGMVRSHLLLLGEGTYISQLLFRARHLLIGIN